MDVLNGLLILLVGIFAGGYGTIVGAGGGFIFVPFLLIFLNTPPIVAAGSGLVIVLINSFAGARGYAKHKTIDYKLSLMIGFSAIPGSIAGVYLLKGYSTDFFYYIFAVILVSMGVILLCKNIKNEQKTVSLNYTKGNLNTYSKKIGLVILGLFMGIFSSYLGIGGGWLLVPILIYVFKVPAHFATATSMFSLFMYSFVGAAFQVYNANVDWTIVLYGGIGVILGSSIGVKIANLISGRVIMLLLSLLLIIIGIRMYFQA